MNVAVLQRTLFGEHLLFVAVTRLRIDRLERRADNMEQHAHDVSAGDRR